MYEKSKQENPSISFPYWAKLWPSALALTRFLQSSPELTQQKSVLEIGAGIALPSFSIARQTRSLIISDHQPDAVELMKRNIELLALRNATALLLDWNHFPPEIKADTILLSDINYSPDQFDTLQQLIIQWITEGSTIVLSTPQRIMAIPFVEKISPYLKEHITEEVIDAGETVLISLMILNRDNPPIA